jgi:catechol 2,3-dioxygenase-like lactoylglutathione lyase family enzyme
MNTASSPHEATQALMTPAFSLEGVEVKTKARFHGGRNIAMKVPPHLYEATIAFYRDVLGLSQRDKHAPSVVFAFGGNNLWIDRVPGLSQAETWLEVVTDDISHAADQLQGASVVRRDEIEPLPPGFQGFWVSSPASIIHLVCRDTDSIE